jgi:hypothetical protein
LKHVVVKRAIRNAHVREDPDRRTVFGKHHAALACRIGSVRR